MHDYSLAKLQSPAAGHVVIRQRLFHLLDQACKKRVSGLPDCPEPVRRPSQRATSQLTRSPTHGITSTARTLTSFYYLRFVIKNYTIEAYRASAATLQFIRCSARYCCRFRSTAGLVISRPGILKP